MLTRSLVFPLQEAYLTQETELQRRYIYLHWLYTRKDGWKDGRHKRGESMRIVHTKSSYVRRLDMR